MNNVENAQNKLGNINLPAKVVLGNVCLITLNKCINDTNITKIIANILTLERREFLAT